MRNSIGVFLLALFSSSAAWASSGGALKEFDVERNPDAYQRGAKVVLDLCTRCHSLKYIKYQNLLDIGFSPEQVDAIRGERKITESLKASMTPEVAKAAFGQEPPDLSVMAKARKGGPHYIYTLLTSYHEDSTGKIDNTLFPGIGMPDVLDMSVEIDENRLAQQDQKAKDVSSFLAWSADPHEDERKTMGAYVIGYLFLLTFLLWLWKRRVWADIKK